MINPDGSCPYCKTLLDVRPVEIEQQINCPSCGRLVWIPPADPAIGVVDNQTMRIRRVYDLDLGLIMTAVTLLAAAIGPLWGLLAAAAASAMLITAPRLSPAELPEFCQSYARRHQSFPVDLNLIPLFLTTPLLLLLDLHRTALAAAVLTLCAATIFALASRRLAATSRAQAARYAPHTLLSTVLAPFSYSVIERAPRADSEIIETAVERFRKDSAGRQPQFDILSVTAENTERDRRFERWVETEFQRLHKNIAHPPTSAHPPPAP